MESSLRELTIIGLYTSETNRTNIVKIAKIAPETCIKYVNEKKSPPK